MMIAEDFDRERLYCSGVVELEEGTKVDVCIESVETKKPDGIKIGMPLKVKYISWRWP